MLSYNLIYLKIMKDQGKKHPKLLLKWIEQHLPGVQALHLAFILLDVWHFILKMH